MTGIANTLRDLERIAQGDCDHMTNAPRLFLITYLERALDRAKNPPPKIPDNVVSLPVRKDPYVGNTPSRTTFKGETR